jgi:hypothetical protein
VTRAGFRLHPDRRGARRCRPVPGETAVDTPSRSRRLVAAHEGIGCRHHCNVVADGLDGVSVLKAEAVLVQFGERARAHSARVVDEPGGRFRSGRARPRRAGNRSPRADTHRTWPAQRVTPGDYCDTTQARRRQAVASLRPATASDHQTTQRRSMRCRPNRIQ